MRKYSFYLIALFLSISLYISGQQSVNTIVYVNIAAQGANSGTSWENAYTNLQDALNNPRATEIWVAQGIYSSPKEGFLIDGFGALGIVLGGFIGNETAVSQRDIDNNITILESSSESSDSPIIFSTSKSNDLIFDGFLLQSNSSNGIVNIELTNCWLGSVAFDNSSEFSHKDRSNERLNSLEISQIETKGDSTSVQLDDIFKVEPTNTTSTITITAPKGSSVQLINYLGKMVKQVKLLDDVSVVDISSQPKGLYIVKLITPTGRIKTERIFLN